MITHLCPPEGSGVMRCCGKTPLEVSPRHRMTLDPALVTCLGGVIDTHIRETYEHEPWPAQADGRVSVRRDDA